MKTSEYSNTVNRMAYNLLYVFFISFKFLTNWSVCFWGMDYARVKTEMCWVNSIWIVVSGSTGGLKMWFSDNSFLPLDISQFTKWGKVKFNQIICLLSPAHINHFQFIVIQIAYMLLVFNSFSLSLRSKTIVRISASNAILFWVSGWSAPSRRLD